MVLYYIQMEQSKPSRFFKIVSKTWIIKTAVIVNILLLVFYTFKPADETSFILKKIYNEVKGDAPILYYKDRNPYNNQASLNYFRNTKIKALQIDSSQTHTSSSNSIYYYSEEFSEGDLIIKNQNVYLKIYQNFPAWFKYLNFNGWLDRSSTFAIYKAV